MDKIVAMVQHEGKLVIATEKQLFEYKHGVFYPIPIEWIEKPSPMKDVEP